MRAAIYARYSTELQHERSIEDQIALCRAYAARERIEITGTFSDHARSGGSMLGRDGLLRLLDEAREKRFEIVIVEALDRLSRDMEDLAGIYKRLKFAGVEIRAVHEGQVNTALVGLRGLVGQLYREDTAHKIRRGLSGRIREGRSAGGLAYGYRAVPGRPGEREIDPDTAPIVRHIFEEYAAGRSPKQIAHGLNRDRIPSPRGGVWNPSTINGHRQRGYGILDNSLYAGWLIWGRCRKISDPETGRPLIRPNAPDQLERRHVPELAIIPPELWQAVQQRREITRQTPATYQRRPRHVLSGLLHCGACGSAFVIYGQNRGKRRIACSRHIQSRTCPRPRTYALEAIQRAVLNALQAEMHSPAAIAEYVKAYQEERRRLEAQENKRRATLQKRIAAVSAELERVIDCIAKGFGDPAVLGPKSTDLHREREELQAELKTCPAPASVIRLHPAIVAQYERQLADLQAALSAGADADIQAAASAIRELIESVTLHPSDKRRGADIEIRGRLNALLGDEAGLSVSISAERVMGLRRYRHSAFLLKACA